MVMRRAGRFRRRASTLPGEDLELVEDYGEVVRRARMEMGLSQEDLAKQLNEKLTIIKKIEAEEFRPSIELARKIERVLKVKLLVPAEEPVDLSGFKEAGKLAGGVRLGDLLKKREED